MNNKVITNIAFILLIILLLISTIKRNENMATNTDLAANKLEIYEQLFKSSAKTDENEIVLSDFPTNDTPQKTQKTTIDYSTAMKYIKTRQLNGTEILELGKEQKLSTHLSKKKKIVIYTNNAKDSDTQAFLDEFAKTRKHFAQNSQYVFIPMGNLWNITEDEIKNSHDRVIYQLKKDCGLFCIINATNTQLLKLKGSNVNKKSAEIIDVILKGI